MERLLHYIWKYRLYDASELTTTDGISFQVLDPGIQNTDAGPDFFNAKIKMSGTVWAGSVEIHDNASDWFLHHHDKDKAYDSVVMHITGNNDAVVCRTNGETIPQTILTIPDAIRENIDWLLHRDATISCLPFISETDPLVMADWLDALLSERLERKANDIMTLLEQYNNDWNEVFYILLTRNFGFGVNSDSFEWLAKSLPFACIQKHRSNQVQIEAMLFGQAGMLEYPCECAYYKFLQREYAFLRHKFGLKPLDVSLFKNLRVRPGNFPHRRLAQLAAIWFQYDTLFSNILETEDLKQIKGYFRIPPGEYWHTHYHFRHASIVKDKMIGEDSLNILVINTVAPMFFAYGLRNNRPEYFEKAIRLLEIIAPEKNSIVYSFSKAGVTVRHAGDSQSLIQLKRAYCEKKKCLYCRLGYRFLKRGMEVT